LVLALSSATLVYISVQVVALGALGPDLISSKAPVAQAAQVLLGHWAGGLILLGSALSMFGYLSSDMLCTPRILFAFARDGFLPGTFAATHLRYQTPYCAIVAHAALVSVLSVSGGFKWLVEQSSVMTLALYLLCCLAAWQLSRTKSPTALEHSGAHYLRTLVPWLACGLILWVLLKQDRATYLGTCCTVVAAWVLYLWRQTARSRPLVRPGEPTEIKPNQS
jgi:amino acid transporter